jgi:hypothetical protein
VEKTEEKIELTFKEMLIQEAWLVDSRNILTLAHQIKK